MIIVAKKFTILEPPPYPNGEPILAMAIVLEISKVIINLIIDKGPSPYDYNTKTLYSTQHKEPSYSFGASRECYKKVYYDHLLGPDKAFPGPGKYNEKRGIGKEGTCYSMRQKESIVSIK